MAEANPSELTSQQSSDTNPQTLLVIGAGPKAIALAAKRAILARLGIAVPRLIIMDTQGIAAHWSGLNGFTDGRQLLGTRPEKDIGFPYASTCWQNQDCNRDIANEMMTLSWPTYLVQQERYSDWIDRGRTRPTHGEWSAYLRWVAEKIHMDVTIAQVRTIGLTSDGKNWQLTCHNSKNDESSLVEGHGLVITGPGDAVSIPGQPDSHPRVLDGNTFWKNVDELTDLHASNDKPLQIGIIGTGETAAAIVIALLNRMREKAFIEVISPYGVLYSRDEGFGENRLFSDPDGKLAQLHGEHRHELSWLSMTEKDRREFVRRTDRGVFSVSAMDEVNRAENVHAVMGTAKRMYAEEDSVHVDIEYDGRVERDRYDYVVVAIGFNPLWFTRLLDERAHAHVAGSNQRIERTIIEHTIGEDLSLQNTVPRLHLPMLAGVAQGPGFPNLSCLGLLSDPVLATYVK